MILTKENLAAVNIGELINEKIKAGRLEELLLIVPTNRKARLQAKELLSLLPAAASAGLNLETIGTLSTKLLSERVRFKPLSEAAAAVILRQSISEVRLEYFSGYQQEIPTGTLKRIKNVISEYKRHGITPGFLLKEAEESTGAEALKALDIAHIYERYAINCSRLSVKEIGDVYAGLNKFSKVDFHASFLSSFPRVNLVIINGFDEFTNPEIEVISSLSQIDGLRLFLNFDYYSFNPLIFSHLKECYDKFISRGFSIAEDRTSISPGEFRNIIRQRLFTKQSIQPVESYKDIITRLEARDRIKEIELVARQVKELILEKGVEPHKICIAFNLIEKYSPIIRDVFSTFGIPFNLTDRIWLNNAPPVVTLVNFLEILENDFYFRNIFRALSGNVLNPGNVSLSGLIKTSARLKIVSGYDNWVNSISAALQASESGSVSQENSQLNDKESLLRSLNDIQTIYRLLQPFTKKMTLREFIAELHNLILSLEIPSGLLDGTGERQEENIRAVSVFMDTIYEIFELLEMEFDHDQGFTLGFFLDRIRTAVSSARFNIRERSDYGVLVTTLDEIRGLKFDYLFISGLCDGDLPCRYSPEIFLSGSYSNARNETVHQTEERYHFYQALCTWEKGLYLSYPLQEETRELAESGFLKEFCELFMTSHKSIEDFRDSLYCKEELLRLAGQAGIPAICSKFPETAQKFNWEHISNSIDIAQLRSKGSLPESIFTGFMHPCNSEPGLIKHENFILSPQAENVLANSLKAQYSISQLEKYALCPYQYFLSCILRLEIIKEPSGEIESFELGTLLHSILFEFYSSLRKAGIVLQQCDDDTFNRSTDLLFKIAESKIQLSALHSPLSFFEIERIMGIDGERENSILFKFLQAERKDSPDFIPEYFEVTFGGISGDDADHELSGARVFSAGDIKVRGKIDRIDINEENNSFSIVDYKLNGRTPAGEDLRAGLSLQLPLYMFAASEMLKAQFQKSFKPAGAFIYSLRYKNKEFGRHDVSGKNGSQPDLYVQLINICLESIDRYVKSISQGKFHISLLQDRENRACRYCDFGSICRIKEIE